MKRVAGLALLALLTAASGVARADLLQDLGATFEQVARELGTAFPKVESRVVAVEGDTVRLEGPTVAALRPGLELTVYRKGEPFRHPITNQIIGHAEEEIAVLTVTAVDGERATARVAVTEGARTPIVGDGARLTAGRMSVAVLPTLGVQVPGESVQDTELLLVSRFSALLEKTGRFLAVEPRRVLETGVPAGGGTPPSALEVAMRLRAPAVLTSRLVQEGPTRYLETAWLSGRTGATLAALRTPLVRAVYPPRFAWEQTPELARRHALDAPVRGLALGDLDGDGRPEVVVADDRAVTVQRWTDGALVPRSGAEFRPGGFILSVDAADVNGTGRAQIIVVDYRGVGETVHSTVLELAGERLRSISEAQDRYLRVIQVGKETWLLEQAVGQAEPFDPRIRRLVWREGRYREGATLRLPRDVSVYGLALMRLTGSPEPEVVALTEEDRLVVWTARGRRIWTSADPYGGPTVSFPMAPQSERREQEVRIGRIRGRLIPLPEGPDGPEVLVFENLFPVVAGLRGLFPGIAPTMFTQGRIHRLRWKDGGFVPVWQSRLTEGYIADFAYGDVDGDGLPKVVVGVVPRGLNLNTLNPVGRPKAHLVFYELP